MQPDGERSRQKSGKYFVYVLECKGIYKIGMTDHMKKRLSGINTASPFDIALIKVYEFETRQKANDFENHLHRTFKGKRLRNGITGEFKEWFTIDALDLDIIEAEHARVKEIKKGIINERLTAAYEYSLILKQKRVNP